MSDTLRFAQRLNLVEMTRRGDLSSTGYALANMGEEYLILQPDTAELFTVRYQAPHRLTSDWSRPSWASD
jgi:hypothetical protein